ncbi:MAG: serine/threonine-protein kinase [Succinivibrio dextrinosolvens]|nr:serine/threonine-protein kinase [Succinivibrio dextrinosolvens]MDY6465097.1 serine/threonine-protein kinase [Succinivibrio dextrinosolvens]
MYFDFLLNVTFPRNKNKIFTRAQELYEACCVAERNARVYPDQCLLNIGRACEILTKCILSEDGFDCERIDLSGLIYNLFESKYISYKDKEIFNRFRFCRNNVAHTETQRTELKFQPNLKNACECTVDLYKQLAKLFKARVPELNAEMLPIGDYEVIKTIKAHKFESVAGNFNYLCKKKGSDIDAFAYVRPFETNEDSSKNVFNERDLEVQNFFSNMRGSSYIIRGTEIPSSNNYCELRYLAYEIRENTKTLDMCKDISAYDALDIISQITTGLKALSTKKINIHHRGIRPSCIFVNKYDDEYEAKIGCFETAKIEYKEREMRTVMSYMVDSQKENPFIHPELVGRVSATDEEWEKGDVYSLAAVLLNCLSPESIQQGNMDCSVLTDYFSDSFFEKMLQILVEGDLEVVPNLGDFLALIESEKELFE